MRFRKQWLGVKSVNFDFSAKSSSSDYSESNNSTRKSLAHYGVWEIACWTWSSKNWGFSYFSFYWKVYFSPWAMSNVKSSSTDFNELYKSNPKPSVYYRVQEIACQTWYSKKWAFSLFFTFFDPLKNLLAVPTDP